MSKFRTTYPSGVIEEYEQSDCDTVEHFANAKFGSFDWKEAGTTIEIVDGETEKPEDSGGQEKPEQTEDETVPVIGNLSASIEVSASTLAEE